ncbi:T-complex protein 1 subunit theta [Tanacetum coccineum]
MLIFSLSKQARQGNKKRARQVNKKLSGLYEAVIKNIDACKELSTVARTSLGPNGTNKLVYKLFLNELVVQYPAAKLLVLAAKEQQKKFGDGANLVVSIAGQHLDGAKELITMGLNPSEIINGYMKASNKACIKVCPKNPVNFNVDNVRVAKFLGASPGASKTFRGMVLKVDTVVGSIKKIENAKVLVIAGGVDTIATETNLIHKVDEMIKEALVHKVICLLMLGSSVDLSFLGLRMTPVKLMKTGARVTVTNEQGGVATVLQVPGSSMISDMKNQSKGAARAGCSQYAADASLVRLACCLVIRFMCFSWLRKRGGGDRESQSMFDRLMAEHHASGESLWQHELPTEKIISTFYESIWTNSLQPKREMEMMAVKSHGDKLFGLSPDGTLSSFDIRSSEVCWSIPTDIALDLDFSYKSFVDSSRVFMHTKETKPVTEVKKERIYVEQLSALRLSECSAHCPAVIRCAVASISRELQVDCVQAPVHKITIRVGINAIEKQETRLKM